MKASTPELLKFQKLMRRLKETRRGVIGLLEGLWLATAKNCPQGDIGRFSNEDIAIMVDWEGDADELVAALIECRWLDMCTEHRLLVHDWEDHCPTYIKGNLKKSEREILTPTSVGQDAPKEPPKEPPKDAPKEPPKDMPTYPNLTKPNQVNPNQAPESEPQAASEPVIEKRKRTSDSGYDASTYRFSGHLDTPEVHDAFRRYIAMRKAKGKSHCATQLACEQIESDFKDYSASDLVTALGKSIVSSWTGVFPPTKSTKNTKPQSDWLDDLRREAEIEQARTSQGS